MSKILKDTEMADIVHRATNDPAVIDCADSYRHFLEDLGQLIADHFGGIAGGTGIEEDTGWYTAFQVNENVPADGGVFNKYDLDVTWQDGTETERQQRGN